MKVTVEPMELTDGSYVYDVVAQQKDGMVWFHCIDEAHAHALADAINTANGFSLSTNDWN